MLRATRMQQQILEEQNKILTLANGRGAGHTHGLLLRSIFGKEPLVHFYNFGVPAMVDAIDKLGVILEESGIDYKYVPQARTFIISVDRKIRFVLPKDQEMCDKDTRFRLRTPEGLLVILDQVDFFPQYFVDYQIQMQERNNNSLTFSTAPFNCGWRDIKFQWGMPSYDEYDEVVLTGQSWDYNLVDWSGKGLNTRATPYDYKAGVTVISGYGINPVMRQENPNFEKCLNDLAPKDFIRLQSEWVKGFDIQESED